MTSLAFADAELRRRLRRELAARIRHGWPMYAVFAVFFASESDFGTAHEGATAIFILGVLLAGIYRTICAQRVLSTAGADMVSYHRVVGMVAFSALWWGSFIAYAFWNVFGNHILETTLIVGVAGFASVGTSLSASCPPLAAFYLAAQCIPALVWSVYARGAFGLLPFTLILAFSIYIAANLPVQYLHSVGTIRAQLLLEARGEELQRAKEAAEQASLIRARFMANMSHEIRTPLNGILGMAQLLGETPLKSEQQQMLRVLQRSGEDLLSIVNDVLDLSKIRAGKMAIERIPFDLETLVRDMATPVSTLAETKGLGWSLEIAPGLAGLFEGDPLRIRQVVGNLLSNAIKFTAAGKVALAVETPRPGWVSFRVCDTGIGIAPQECPKLFQDFAQADSSTTRRFGGTGLGLSISKNLADLMGGALTVKSELGRGSEFRFEIPLAHCSTPRDTGANIEPAPAPELRLPAGFRILVAEDNLVNRMIAERFLKCTGAIVEQAENGAHAVAMHAANPYDLILMDCHMPEMDGFEATAAIRAQASDASSVPIIAVTASAFAEDRERCLQAGMNDHISKPLRRGALLDTIATVVGRAAMRSKTGPRPHCPRLLSTVIPDSHSGGRAILPAAAFTGGSTRRKAGPQPGLAAPHTTHTDPP